MNRTTKSTSAPPKRWLASLAALAVGVVAAAVLFEGLTLLLFGEQPKFPRHVVGAPWGLRYNEPLATYRHKSADITTYFRINGQGMRADVDYAHDKPIGVSRVVSLGDSFTIGYEVDLEDCYSSVLERELRDAGRDAEVLNTGVSGFSTAEEYLYLQRELVRYDPDVVVISFVMNDFVDNVRTGLLRLDGDRLVAGNPTYVPAGSLGDFLNSNVVFNLLSERSNAFVLAKERVTHAIKRRLVEANRDVVRRAEAAPQLGAGADHDASSESSEARRLTVAIYEDLYAFLRERDIPLVIHSIPHQRREPTERFVETFPLDDFDVERPGIYFVPAADLLTPYAGKEQIVWERSHHHWTPLAHRVVGRELASVLIENGLVD